ncbi:MAG TPA: methionyl-tRNA formyltransferase [Bacilli bacterium]
MRILFMGTPEFAVPSLEAILEEGHEVIAVITQPDRPKGRKKLLTPSAVKLAALSRGIPVLQPVKLRDALFVDGIIHLHPDLIVTAAYGQILPKAVLQAPTFGCINVHGSLLPKYRGGAPIQRSIINGEKVTGVTIMYMAAGLDTGDIISQVEAGIAKTDTSGTMFDKLSRAGAQLLKETLPVIFAGKATPIPQNHREATYAPNLSREDERVDWTRSSEEIYNQVRGLNPWPGAYTLWNDEVLKIWSCRLDVRQGGFNNVSGAGGYLPQPGTVLQSSPDGIQVATGSGTIWLTVIQPAGKKAMDTDQFNRGSGLSVGTILI